MWPNVLSAARTAEAASGDGVAVEPSAQLLAPFQALTDAIRVSVGVPDSHWQKLYLPVLHNYAAVCQRLPASEAHHHAEPGGLLRHGLETLFEAILARRKHLLPPGAPAEEIAAQEDLWTYAAATSALLHDVGKPIADLLVTYVTPADTKPQTWQPLTALLPQGTYYRYRFRSGREYQRHELLPPLLAHRILPAEGIDWLASQPAVFDAWLATISSAESAGPLSIIAHEADGASVARDLSGGIRTRSPAARARPVAERLLTGLRHLVKESVITLNRPGASGFVADGSLWLVSKRVLDDLRDHLAREGQTGIPARNDRLMDELQQWHVIEPNGEQAVWYCDIRVGDWYQTLSCLRVRLDRFWADPAEAPAVDGVSVTPAPRTASRGVDACHEQAASQSLVGAAEARPATSSSESSLPTVPSCTLELKGATAPVKTAPPSPVNLSEEQRSLHRHAALQAASPDSAAEDVDGVDVGMRFVQWLKDNLRDGRLEVNTPRARVHVIPEGLALITPGIFRDFSPEHWDRAQKRFQKLKVHKKTDKDTNIWTCQVMKDRKSSTVKVMLIPDAADLLGIEIPEPNPVMTLVNARQ